MLLVVVPISTPLQWTNSSETEHGSVAHISSVRAVALAEYFVHPASVPQPNPN